MSGSEHLMQKKFGSEYGFSVKNGLMSGLMLTMIPVITMQFAGVVGMGYFSCAYLFYLGVCLFSGFLIPYCTSRVAGTLVKKGRIKECFSFGTKGIVVALLVGIFLAGSLFFVAEDLAYYVMRSGASAVSLKMLAPTILLMPVIGVLRGMLQGFHGKAMIFLSQVVEFFGNIVASGVFSYFLYKEGVKMDVMKGEDIYRYAYGSGGASLGILVGTVLAFGVLILFYVLVQKSAKGKGRSGLPGKRKKDGLWVAGGLMIPLAIAGIATMMIPLISQNIVGNYLRRNVMESTYISEWGIFVGCYLALAVLPVIFSVMLGTLTVPLVRKEVTNETRISLVYSVRLAIRLTMMGAIPASFAMLFLSYPMLMTLFPVMEDVSAPMVFLLAGFPLVMLMALAGITSLILVGMNRSYTLSFHTVFAFAGFMICCEALMRTMNMGIYSANFGMLIFALLLSTLNILTIDRGLGMKQEWKKSYMFPLLASLLAGIAAVGAEYALLKMIPEGVVAFLGGAVVYVLILLAVYSIMKMLDEGEVYELPDGRKWYKILHKIHLVK